MKITSIKSQFTLKVEAISGLDSEMSVTLEATPNEGETWDLAQAKLAHVDLAESAVKEVFTALIAEGAVDGKEGVTQLKHITNRFTAIRNKRAAALQEILAHTVSEEINAY